MNLESDKRVKIITSVCGMYELSFTEGADTFECVIDGDLGNSFHISDLKVGTGGPRIIIDDGLGGTIIPLYEEDFFWVVREYSLTLAINRLDALIDIAGNLSTSKGFREGYDPNDPRHAASTLALITTEVAEAVEAVRKPGPSEHIPQFSGLEEELADVVIRCMDMADAHDLDLLGAINAKLVYNSGRGHKHGGKVI